MGTVSVLPGTTTAGSGATAPRSPTAVGERFVAALAGRDGKGIATCFRAKARLRALVPHGPQEHQGARVISRVFMAWFESAETIRLVGSASESMADRLHIRYRFRETFPGGDSALIEQDAFCTLDHGRILAMDLVCSGHRREPRETNPSLRRFDAGDLGCGSGLPQEFRRQVSSIPIGSILEVVTRDPSAKEDLPSMARLLGHEVLSVANSADGSTAISVRRIK